MKFFTVLPFIGLGTAFVLPNQQEFGELAIETRRDNQKPVWSEEARESFQEVSDKAKNALDDALTKVSDVGSTLSSKIHDTAFDAQSWLESAAENTFDVLEDHEHPHPPHHGPPDHDHPPHHGPPDHDHPHHPPHHEPNQTVYELISKSKYTTKLAKLLNDYPDLVEALNGTKANYTVFAPTDKAFERIPEHAPKPSKEDLKKILSYHVSPDFYPAGRVLATHTIPTLLKGEDLPGKHSAQRLSVNVGLRGLTINFYSRVVAINIFGTNGVIHGVDHIIVPPPQILKIVSLLPSEFSTLELALSKTGLNTTDHPSGTLFAPSNFAFSRLGARINAFLFSPRGLPYLEALLKYHMVPHHTLYSDAYYKSESESDAKDDKGLFHVDLPTALEGRSLSVDIAKYYGIIEMKINSFARVSVFDGVASDGVIQVVSSVLVPPKKLGGVATRLPKLDFWSGGKEMALEEFIERFEPFVKEVRDL